MKKVLIVDDEASIRDIIGFTLEKDGYEFAKAKDGEEALELFEEYQPDIVILDLMLPKIDGLEVCLEIRKKSQVPIIMQTAKSDEFDKVLGLEMGADDYVTKPFSNRELLARVKANLRRTAISQEEAGPEEKQAVYEVGDLTINAETYRVTKGETPIELTHREFELLLYLAQHKDQVVTREDLLKSVWGYDYFGDVRTVDVTVRRLREKIEQAPSHPEILITRRGVGYYVQDNDQE